MKFEQVSEEFVLFFLLSLSLDVLIKCVLIKKEYSYGNQVETSL